jgi:hypothetical protein
MIALQITCFVFFRLTGKKTMVEKIQSKLSDFFALNIIFSAYLTEFDYEDVKYFQTCVFDELNRYIKFYYLIFFFSIRVYFINKFRSGCRVDTHRNDTYFTRLKYIYNLGMS